MPTYLRKLSPKVIRNAGINTHRLIGGSSILFSVKHRTTYFPLSHRNGAKECARRIKQGLGGLNVTRL